MGRSYSFVTYNHQAATHPLLSHRGFTRKLLINVVNEQPIPNVDRDVIYFAARHCEQETIANPKISKVYSNDFPPVSFYKVSDEVKVLIIPP